MRSRRKSYYHKTIVIAPIFSNMMLFLLVLVFAVGILVSQAGNLQVLLSRRHIISAFTRYFPADREIGFYHTTIYDHIFSVFPGVKSGEEMMKKYEAKYGGIKKELSLQKEDKQETKTLPGVGKVKELDMSENGITFRNETGYTPDLDALLATPLGFSKQESAPRVLILHTHTSEAYAESTGGRSTDNDKNVVHVGYVIAETLKQEGISVVHDVTRNDFPSYNGSYTKALSNIQKQLESNPTIEVVLDVHRDYAEQTKNGEALQLKPTATVEGRKTAQVMFVVGTDGRGLTHPHWKENLAFAVQIQKRLQNVSPKLARPINLRRERFNQHMTKGSLIVEMGTAGNTLEECERLGVYIGRAVAEVIKNN